MLIVIITENHLGHVKKYTSGYYSNVPLTPRYINTILLL